MYSTLFVAHRAVAATLYNSYLLFASTIPSSFWFPWKSFFLLYFGNIGIVTLLQLWHCDSCDHVTLVTQWQLRHCDTCCNTCTLVTLWYLWYCDSSDTDSRAVVTADSFSYDWWRHYMYSVNTLSVLLPLWILYHFFFFFFMKIIDATSIQDWSYGIV